METKEMTMSARVAQNVRRLRVADDLTLAGLSERLAEQGHPIGLTTLSKIELGQRRIDVDDLVALARALGTSETYLLTDPQQQLNREAHVLHEMWKRAKWARINELRRLDEEVGGRWAALVEYAGQSQERHAAVEAVLGRTFGEDDAIEKGRG